ncbi:MAG TPA: hypothetical protein VF553_09800 [Pyrinomonadaceae bacterium]|jgi:hypothetical protein
MAGDLNINEQVIVLTAGAPVAGAQAAVEQVSGGVTHQYGQRVIIAAAPPATSEALQQQAPYATMATESAAIPQAVMGGLDKQEALGLEAFSLRQSQEYKAAKAARPLAEEPWDSGAGMAPDAYHEEAGAAEAEAEAAAPTSSRLTGKVAVSLIIVEGPTAALKFSTAERTKVVAEVQNGLSWLGSQSSPGAISWVYDIQIVTLTVQPGPASETGEQKEARWRDPAMAKLGYGPGLANVQTYVEKLRQTKGTDWAYCAFFTKYPLGHFAYASIGGPRLVMDYNNDGWGPDNIDRVFAHETGHIFNAPDEYASSGCNCGGSWGVFGVPNTNCENCAPSGGVPCLMKANTWAMCSYTPYHLGFPQGQRYSGVFQAGAGNYGLWVNADWNHFVAKWQEWSGQGLRLDDIEVSQPGGQLRFSGVFRAGTGGYGLWGLADWNNFVAKWQEWSGQGLRLVDLEITKVGSDWRYTGVYQAGTGGYGLWVNADWNNFVAKWKEWSAQGLRLVDLSIIESGGKLLYSGVFRAGTDGYGLWALADWNSFVAKWQEWSGQGLRLVDFEITKVGNDTRYSGVFRQGAGAYGLWVNADWSSFVNKWNEWSGQGMRLTDFDITLTGIEAAASPVASESATAAGAAADDSSVGFGFLSTASSTSAGSDGAGMGFMTLSGSESTSGDQSESSGAGMGSMSLSGSTSGSEDASGAGMGSMSLSGSESSGRETNGAGMGSMSLTGSSSGSEESGRTSRGSKYGSGAQPGGSEASGSGFGSAELGG